MSKIILMIAAITGSCCVSGWHFGGHEGGFTLGEISLSGHGHALPAIELGDSGHWSSGHSGLEPSLIDVEIGQHGGHFAPVVKEIGVPVVKKVEFEVPYPVVQKVPQPYPVSVPVGRPVPYEVVKHVIKKVEKKVPVPIEKIVPYKVEKPVPYTVYKSVPVTVEKPVAIKIPIYKTIVHKSHDK